MAHDGSLQIRAAPMHLLAGHQHQADNEKGNFRSRRGRLSTVELSVCYLLLAASMRVRQRRERHVCRLEPRKLVLIDTCSIGAAFARCRNGSWSHDGNCKAGMEETLEAQVVWASAKTRPEIR